MKNAVTVICLVILLTACQTVPQTAREQLLLTSPETEMAMGEQAFRSIMRGQREITEGEAYESLQVIGQRIVMAAEPMLEARGFGDLEWSFHLVDSNTINAFVVPSGQVVFFRGILPVLENENGIAAVMGHEVAHVIARHGGERISQRLLATGATYGLAAAMADTREEADRILAAAGIATLFLLEMPYSRRHELEADYLGAQLMAMAGYDPRESVKVWARMEEATLSVPAFLSTHPHSRDRRDRLEERMPEFLSLSGQ